jgi:hypothetical protein
MRIGDRRSWVRAIARNRKLGAWVALAIVSAFFPSLLGSAGAAGTAPPAALIPANGLYFGAYVGPRGGETRQMAIQRVESQIGRTLAIDHQYERWDSTFPNAYETWSAQQGRIQFINWKPSKGGTPIPWSRIASGAEDDVIKARADAIKAFGKPIYLTFHHEPENDVGTFGTPQDFAAAFRHVVEVMRARGVTNVAYVWTMMAASFSGGTSAEAANFWPGDDVVDLIGSDGYNWYPAKAGTQWRSFRSIFQPSQDFAQAHHKPWMTVEYGVQEDPADPGRKAAWFRDALETAKSWQPSLTALMYFDTTKLYPWDTDSSPTSMNGYKTIGADPSTALMLSRPAPSPTQAPSPSPTVGPAPTPSPAPSPSPAPIEGLWWNTLDGGPAGANITPERTANTGTPFDQVVVERGATLTFHEGDSGRMSARHEVANRENAYYLWNKSFGQQSLWFGRVSVKFDGLPAGDLRLIRSKDDDTLQFAIDVMRDGRVRIVDAKNRRIGITSTPILANTWNRIECMIDQRTGVIQVAVFTDVDATTPAATVSTSTGNNIGTRTNEVEIGRSGSQHFSEVFWTDDPAVSTAGWIGPA